MRLVYLTRRAAGAFRQFSRPTEYMEPKLMGKKQEAKALACAKQDCCGPQNLALRDALVADLTVTAILGPERDGLGRGIGMVRLGRTGVSHKGPGRFRTRVIPGMGDLFELHPESRRPRLQQGTCGVPSQLAPVRR